MAHHGGDIGGALEAQSPIQQAIEAQKFGGLGQQRLALRQRWGQGQSLAMAPAGGGAGKTR